MAIFKDGEFYKAEIYTGCRRIKSKRGFKNKSQAKNWHDEQKVLLKIDPLEPSNDNCKFSDMIEKYIEDYICTSVKETTRIRYLTDINKRIIPEFVGMKATKITAIIVQNFQNKLVKSKKLKPASINRCMIVLHSIFEKGIIWELCRVNPCKKVKRLKEVRKPYRWWYDRNIIFRFLNQTEGHHYYLLYRVALETGMRLGELVGLAWDAVNLETGQIEVYQQYNVQTGLHAPLKNNQYRTVWLTVNTVPLLRELRLKSNSDYVFSKPDGSVSRGDTVANEIFHALQKKAGVPQINFHGLRHTYASHYMMNGGELYDLSKLLGHSSIEVTMKYAHLSPEALRKNRDRVSFDDSNIAMLEKNSSLRLRDSQGY